MSSTTYHGEGQEIAGLDRGVRAVPQYEVAETPEQTGEGHALGQEDVGVIRRPCHLVYNTHG